MRGGYEMSSTCIQGGLPRPLGGYQANLMMEPHSPPTAWQFHSVVPKQESNEERNDSGINSASDCHSSSPGSENSTDAYSIPSNQQIPITQNQPYYSTPMRAQNPMPMMYNNLQNLAAVQMMYHNNMQSPSRQSPQNPMVSPTIKQENIEADSTLTRTMSPQTSPKPDDIEDDPLKRLQMTMERNLFPSALSPKMSEHSNDDDNKSDNEPEEYDENGLRIPRINSHGKIKTFKCKQCDFVAITKLDFWEHTKGHIKADKLLTCPKCPFVTEYKHHLEYHLRNHAGSKPFKCDKCSYSCVNKSMLNSHLKSHSNIYQYRCADCSYATKYCHSLKLHLRKYTHKPAMVLNPDGSPNPLPIIDVYGTRRGPKIKPEMKMDSENPNQARDMPMLPYQLQQLMMTPPAMQLPFPYPWLPGQMILQNLERLARGNVSPNYQEEHGSSTEEEPSNYSEALDLTKDGDPGKNRRKGPAFKLETTPSSHQSSDEEDEDMTTTVFDNVEVVDNESNSVGEKEKMNNNNEKADNSCQYCNINFGDPVLYTMHMGYHGYKDPFTCNMCGEECNDKVSFFLHIARTPHN